MAKFSFMSLSDASTFLEELKKLLKSLAYKDSASGSFTPSGTNSGGNVTLSKTTVNSITNVGSMPTFTVNGTNLTITNGTPPTKGADVSVATDIDTITQPTFTGTQGTVTVE